MEASFEALNVPDFFNPFSPFPSALHVEGSVAQVDQDPPHAPPHPQGRVAEAQANRPVWVPYPLEMFATRDDSSRVTPPYPIQQPMYGILYPPLAYAWSAWGRMCL